MSTEQVQAFLKAAENTNFRTAFETATDQVKRQMLNEAGLDISVEEALAALATADELADEDLNKVAGGDAGVIRYPYPPTTNP
jgi:predicted ribosomally synthesized peptide with nif11-like leader